MFNELNKCLRTDNYKYHLNIHDKELCIPVKYKIIMNTRSRKVNIWCCIGRVPCMKNTWLVLIALEDFLIIKTACRTPEQLPGSPSSYSLSSWQGGNLGRSWSRGAIIVVPHPCPCWILGPLVETVSSSLIQGRLSGNTAWRNLSSKKID